MKKLSKASVRKNLVLQ